MLILLVALRLPQRLQISTDIVGYPIFAGYNIVRLAYLYYLTILGWPAATLLLYLLISRLTSRRRTSSAPTGQAPGAPASSTPWLRTTGGARTLLVGLVFGLEAMIILGASGPTFWLGGLGVAAGYALLLGGLVGLRRPKTLGGSTTVTLLARLNGLAATLTVMGLFGVSAMTRVTVTADGATHSYRWIPLGLALCLTVTLFGWLWHRALIDSSTDTILRLERNTVLYLVVPVAIIVCLAALPAALGPMDVFHEGERLASAELTRNGFFPWRDIISTHGVLEDSLFPLLGFVLIQDSRWGDIATQSLLLGPAFFTSFYLFAAWAFRRNWAFLAAVTLLIVGPELWVPSLPRYLFWPALLLLLAAVLERSRWWLSLLFGSGLALQAVLVPELAYCIPACAIVVVLYEFAHRRQNVSLAAAFARTLWAIAGGAGIALALALLLLEQHALGDFVRYYLIFAPGHALTGGLPLHLRSQGRRFVFIALSPIGTLLLAFCYYAAKLFHARRLESLDWVMGAATIFAAIFYTRFLDRADLGHAYLSFTATIPVLAFVVFRFTSAADRALTRTRGARFVLGFTTRPATVMFLFATLLAVGPPLLKSLDQSTGRVRSVVPGEPSWGRLGYLMPGAEPASYGDLSKIVSAYVGPRDWVFDFSNEPGLYYYLLGRIPRTRYFHISMAIPELAQKDLIGELRRQPPKLVVFDNQLLGLPSWDGISNSVRHYDVSQYILDNYTPLLSMDTQVIYGLASAHLTAAAAMNLPLSSPPLVSDLYFKSHSCDWGDAPNFLSIDPPAPIQALTATEVSIRRAAGPLLSGWAADAQTHQPVSQVVVVLGSHEVSRQPPGVARPDVAAAYGDPQLGDSGFRLEVPFSGSGFRVFGLTSGGVATELSYSGSASGYRPLGAAPPLVAIQLANGVTAPVRPGAVLGFVDEANLVTTLDRGAVTWSLYRWLEITTGSGLRDDSWWMSNSRTSPERQIAFRTLAGKATRYRVYVGNCSQWHGYSVGEGAAQLYLFHEAPQDILKVRLLP